ncbi:MAG: hypothetical protein ABR587_08350, partial [Candidatus Binatia bacterium]
MLPFIRSGLLRQVRVFAAMRSLGLLFSVAIGTGSPAWALTVPTNCLPDSDGANDVTGIRDVTLYCGDTGDALPYELNVITNLDVTTITGGSTVVTCVLFNTDGDAFANLAVCVTTDGDGVGDAVALEEIRLFTCNDTRADRCAGPSQIAGPFTTECEVTQENTDPFPGPAPGPGQDYPADTQILCGIDLDDFSALSAVPIDVCSYASSNPNSNPIDCLAFSECDDDSDCNDGNSCTIDTCDTSGTVDVCAFTPDVGAVCDDGQFCNGEEECTDLGLCGAGSGGPVDCDDGVSCTLDTCDELGDVCQNDPMNSLCSDDLFCTGVETCDAVNDCQAGSSPDCSDGVNCTTDTCNEANDNCEHEGNDGSCDNGLFCDGSETCDELTGCEAGTPPDCGDGIDCTTDSCDETADECAHAPDDADCSDGQFCTGEETCVVGVGCAIGPVPDCDDGIECTDDACNEGTDSCDHGPDDDACADGEYCNGDETCNPSTGCTAGVEPDCGDGVLCTIDSCNEATDECDHATSDAACTDGAFCNGEETCDATLDCQPGTAPDCDDSVGCTIDSCNEASDVCDHDTNDASCSDGQFCNGDETCDATQDCQPGTAPLCDDGVGCTVDDCNESTDECDYTPDNASCSDGEFCTGVEICDPVEDCDDGTNPCPNLFCDEGGDVCVDCLTDGDCDNSVFCDGVETCVEGVCTAGPAVDCDDSVGCTVDECNETNDVCDNTPSNAICDDGLHCNGDEFCDETSDCQNGIAPDCDDAVGCTIDTCNETSDLCDHEASDALCDNDEFCDGSETCDAVLDCQDGTSPNCDDGVGCTDDSCNEDNDECDHVPDDAPCADGVICNGVETCDVAAGCLPAAGPLDCDDGIECTADGCNESVGCTNSPNDVACDDGLHCDGVEVCNASTGCEEGTPVDCSDGVGCTVDTCDEATDSCGSVASDALCDDGQYCNGVETCHPVTDCLSGNPVICADQIICTTDSCNEATDSCASDFSTCVCGDSEVTGAEQCDPPAAAGTFEDCNDGIDNDSDGRIDCRDQDCRPAARTPVCDEACTLDQVCLRFIRDPARIYYNTTHGPDELYIHGRIPMRGEKLRSVVHAVTVEVSNVRGPIYRSFLDEGDMRGGIAGRRFRFRDTQARYLGGDSARDGLEKLAVRTRRFGGSRFLVFTIRAYGDFSKATH